ncbi:hypothetical protein [Bacteroides fragilis]|uniref:hypothetical protein n=1 Tax=Bacteroides fragilis TaxID=817 RepID=UPI003218E8A4
MLHEITIISNLVEQTIDDCKSHHTNKNITLISTFFFTTYIGDYINSAISSKSKAKQRVKLSVTTAMGTFLSTKVHSFLYSGSTGYTQTVISRKYLGN